MGASQSKRLAIVFSGGGARGAYEAGIVHYIRTMLPENARTRTFDISCGASVGAINAAFVASTAHDPKLQGLEAYRLWQLVREEDIYRRDRKALFEFLGRSTKGIVSNLFKKKPDGKHFNGFLDTQPFLPFIKRIIPWENVSRNIDSGVMKALSIVTTNVFTGRTELFVQKSADVEYTGHYITHFTTIDPSHVMASAAIPLVFPTVMVDQIAYTDGGLRLNTPMSPAIQLGADKVLVIGLHHRAKNAEEIPFHGERGKPPAMGQVLGRVMNSIFLDRINYDMEQLERINRIIDWGEMTFGKNYLDQVNQMLLDQNITGDIANRGLKRIEALRFRPSEDIGEIFSDCFKKEGLQHFSSFEKFLVRFLDVNPAEGIDFLSYISFMPGYIKRLLDLGFEDARKMHNQLTDFLDR